MKPTAPDPLFPRSTTKPPHPKLHLTYVHKIFHPFTFVFHINVKSYNSAVLQEEPNKRRKKHSSPSPIRPNIHSSLQLRVPELLPSLRILLLERSQIVQIGADLVQHGFPADLLDKRAQFVSRRRLEAFLEDFEALLAGRGARGCVVVRGDRAAAGDGGGLDDFAAERDASLLWRDIDGLTASSSPSSASAAWLRSSARSPVVKEDGK
jgi:hypothetical protein